MLEQLNGTLEEESRTLFRQLDVLISQNEKLYEQNMNDKEHNHAREIEFQ